MRLTGWALASLASIVCSGAFVSCGESPGGSTPTSPGGGGSTTTTITINGSSGTQAFTPNPASFGGQSVVFRNNDSVTHRVVLNDGSVDTGDIAPGATSRAVTMPAAGTNYHCSLHPGMIGAVSGTAGQTPECTGLYCDPY
jgi:plastocyanin